MPRSRPEAGGPAMPARIIANGQELEVELPRTLESFLLGRGLPPRSVVVELNGEALSPSQFPQCNLRDGDRLEIVRIVAGG